jgi:hypothetical protein
VLAELARDRRLAADCARALGGIPGEASARALLALLDRREAAEEAAEALAGLPAGLVVPLLLERFEGRQVRPLLARFAGADLGGRVEAWRTWWDGRP